MKKTLIVVAVSGLLSTQAATAGNMADPIMEVELVAQQAGSYSNPVTITLPLIIFSLFVAVARH